LNKIKLNEIKYSQAYLIVALLPLAYKITTLPAALFEVAGVACYIVIGAYAIIEGIMTVLIFKIINLGGIGKIKEKFGDNIARLVSAPLLIVCVVKITFYLFELGHLAISFFYNTNPLALIILAIGTICYMGYKGAKSISYLFTVVIWMIPLIILVGVIFGRFEYSWYYIVPFRDKGFSDAMTGMSKFVFYLFDLSFFLFVKLIQPPKKKKLLLSNGIYFVCVIILYLAFIAVFGNTCGLVNNAYGKLTSYNTVVSEIGSLNTLPAIFWTICALILLGFYMFEIGSISELFNVKRKVSIPIFGLIIVIIVWCINNCFDLLFTYITQFWVYIILTIQVVIPLVWWCLLKTSSAPKIKQLDTNKKAVQNDI